jgi:RNA polymerase-interacting CarD/CdnL/TRCF family regulator
MAKPSAELLDLIEVAAELRTLGKSWETVATTVGRSARTVRGWPRAYPDAWRQAYRDAEEQLVVEAAAESVLVLRNLLRSEDDKVRRDAARQLLSFRLELAKLEGKANAAKKPSSAEAERIAAFLSERDDDEVQSLVDDLLSRRGEPEGDGE